MPEAHKISQDEWNKYKQRLRSLYLEENKTLKETIDIVGLEHGFRPTPAQYIRQFKKWGFEKNSSSDQWKQIITEVGKRKSRGKDSEVYLKDKHISSKKLRKEMSRYASSSHETMYPHAESELAEEVVVQTPRTESASVKVIEHSHIPWFQFETLFQPYFKCDQHLKGKLQYPSIHSMEQLFPLNWTCSHNMVSSMLPTEQGPGAQFLAPLDLQYHVYTPAECPQEVIPLSSNVAGPTEEALAVLASCLGVSKDPRSADYDKEVFSKLDDVTIEMQDGELSEKFKNLNDSCQVNSKFELFRYLVYLSSNNLLSDNKTDKFVEWIAKSDALWILTRLTILKTPMTEIFGSNILVSAARLGYHDIVRHLIKRGVNVNALSGQTHRRTALIAAIEYCHTSIVQTLLNAGANPNFQLGSSYSALHEAVEWSSNIEIVQMLLSHCADPNGIFKTPFMENSTVLMIAAERNDLTMVRMLLGAGAHVDAMPQGHRTALQASIGHRSNDVAQLLIGVGADIDAPVGEIYESARIAAADAQEFGILSTPIQLASKNDDVELVQILLEAGADVDACPWDEFEHGYDNSADFDLLGIPTINVTALQAAAKNGNSVLVRLLLAAGADVDAGRCRHTALQIAAYEGHLKTVKILLKHGADINAPARGKRGKTAIQAAVTSGNVELIQHLLDSGADVNAQTDNSKGMTALQGAASRGDIEIAEILIQAGADVNAAASSEGGRTSLQAAAENGHVEMVQLLLYQGANVNGPPAALSDGITALQAAIKYYDYTIEYWVSAESSNDKRSQRKSAWKMIMDLLFDAGANVQATSSLRDASTVLSLAVATGNKELVERILQKGANVNEDSTRNVALGVAVKTGNMELASLLLEVGADVNVLCCCINLNLDDVLEDEDKDRPPTIYSVSALHLASWYGCLPMAKLLLKAGAKIDIPTSKFHQSLALQSAVKRGHREMVELLLSEGADVNACSSAEFPNKSTALEEALSGWSVNDAIVSMLIESGADPNYISRPTGLYPLTRAAKSGRRELVKLLLQAGASVNAVSQDRMTALQAAISTRNIDLIEMLIEAGADVNAPAGPRNGRTALQRSAEIGDVGLVALLLSHGADVNAPPADSYGITALQGAMVEGSLKIVRMLLQAGARRSAPPSRVEGRLALEAAAEHGRLDIVYLLLRNDDDKETLEGRSKRAAKLAAANGHCVIARVLREYKVN